MKENTMLPGLSQAVPVLVAQVTESQSQKNLSFVSFDYVSI